MQNSDNKEAEKMPETGGRTEAGIQDWKALYEAGMALKRRETMGYILRHGSDHFRRRPGMKIYMSVCSGKAANVTDSTYMKEMDGLNDFMMLNICRADEHFFLIMRCPCQNKPDLLLGEPGRADGRTAQDYKRTGL